MTNQHVDAADRHRPWVIATCGALVLAAVGDAGPEIIESGSIFAGYDGPGPLIYLGFAAVVSSVRWRFAPLSAVAMAAFFLFGGFADDDFVARLVTWAGAVSVAAWLQMLSFAAVIVCGTAAVRRRRPKPHSLRPYADLRSTTYDSTMTSEIAVVASIPGMNLVPRSRKVVAVLGALGIAILGLLIQFAGDPAKFWPFPPGIYFILGAALVVCLMQRWRIAPLAGILIGLWITFGGIVRGELFTNLASGDALTIIGNIVMEIGLLGAVIVGAVAIAAPDRIDDGVPA